MRVLWTICACAACLAGLAATQSADFPIVVIVTALVTLVLTWL